MTTLKLNKKPTKPATNRKPVRRADPTKRDRSKPPAPKQRKTQTERPTETVNAQQESNRPILRSEFKDRAFVDKAPAKKQPSADNKQSNANDEKLDTSRHYKDREGGYRNPPRRGGKVRDGFVASEFDKNRTHQNANAQAQQASEKPPRLSKRMTELGLCSRREADEWIANGWVKVDGEIIDVLGTRVSREAEIVVSAYAMEEQAENVTILLHKPVGYVSGQAEDGYQPAIVLVHPDNEWVEESGIHTRQTFQRRFLRGLAPAGRLDIDSTGLLVLTQDGRVARHLIGQDSSVEKEYLVRVEGELSDADLKLLNHGLSLDGEKLKPAKVSWQNKEQLRFVLREGKKRQIRRMCEMVGLHVIGLKRIRIGSVKLGKLPPGQWRYLHNSEQF